MRELVLASSNPHKLAEMSEALQAAGIGVVLASDIAPLPEIDETGSTLAENAALKATAVANGFRRWTVGDDTGLFVPALNGAPGIHSARFAGPHASALENREKLLRELAAIPESQRGAYFECCLVVADSAGTVRLTLTGRLQGIILTEPRGRAGFGYDSLFMIREYHRTLAELSLVTTSVLSHRGRLLRQLAPKVVRLLGD
jgi:XTP/dITP diphosphohydrolase